MLKVFAEARELMSSRLPDTVAPPAGGVKSVFGHDPHREPLNGKREISHVKDHLQDSWSGYLYTADSFNKKINTIVGG